MSGAPRKPWRASPPSTVGLKRAIACPIRPCRDGHADRRHPACGPDGRDAGQGLPSGLPYRDGRADRRRPVCGPDDRDADRVFPGACGYSLEPKARTFRAIPRSAIEAFRSLLVTEKGAYILKPLEEQG